MQEIYKVIIIWSILIILVTLNMLILIIVNAKETARKELERKKREMFRNTFIARIENKIKEQENYKKENKNGKER